MRHRLLRLGAALLALSACRPEAVEPPAPQPAATAPQPVNPVTRVQTYHCEDGAAVEAGYPDRDTAVVTVGGHAYTLKAAVAASGVRYVGLGLQWWTKGMNEARLSRLKPGEDVASDPGVTCRVAAAEVAPPTPGTLGGLPDDRTPPAESRIAPNSAQGAAQLVQTYYALIETGRYAEAWRLWGDGGKASDQSEDAFAKGFEPYASYHAQIGAPGVIEGAAGSLYVEVPVVIYGARRDGRPLHESGKATLRRINDVPGSTAEERRWHIARIELAD